MIANRKSVSLAIFFLFCGGCAQVEHSAGGVLDNGASVIREVGRQPWYVEDSGSNSNDPARDISEGDEKEQNEDQNPDQQRRPGDRHY
ncbi:MAG: hypothetical protein PHC51_14430 [bacterium]|nr:hypothetical protein [bacterium]